jgi:hypothetical protein
MLGIMKERDMSLREDVESSKLQVSIPKDQELRNLTTSRYHMPNPKKQQHYQGRASAKNKAQNGREPNSSRTSGSWDEALAPMKNMTLLTSVACVRDN